MRQFASVVLDVDSTLCGIEGIDFLAKRRGPEVGARIADLTDRTMRGEIALEEVYGERLAVIRPTTADLMALREAYALSLAPGAADAIRAMREAGVGLALVSGGIRQAIEPVAHALGFADGELAAVSISIGPDGQYESYDRESPLATQRGKSAVVASLLAGGRLARPLLAVGDGSTDVFMREHADAFAGFVGFARRDNVVAEADLLLESFDQLASVVLNR